MKTTLPLPFLTMSPRAPLPFSSEMYRIVPARPESPDASDLWDLRLALTLRMWHILAGGDRPEMEEVPA